MKVSFLYNAQLHQIPHSLPIALELASRNPDIEVDIAAFSARHLDFARELARRYGTTGNVQYVPLRRPWFVRARAFLGRELAPNKKLSLLANLSYLSSCDALVTPEWTSLSAKRSGRLPNTRFIFTGHGAGDRAVTVNPDIAEFDFVLVPGAKLEARMLEGGVIRPGAFASGVYAKFDWLHRMGATNAALFDNGRPTVLYSPHFDSTLSSWHAVGWKVLDYFATSTRYNLVFAPHVRLFEPPRPSKYRAFEKYRQLPHMLIDLGSERCVDMSYTLGADAYIGDVSSQVAEFMLRPRPCLFLNPRRTSWQGNPDYRFWNLGPVLEDVGGLNAALHQAFSSHADYLQAQRDYFSDTFDRSDGAPSAQRGADAIAEFLRRGA